MKILHPSYRRVDERGILEEISLNTWKQVNILHIKKDEVFGGHYHLHKTELFYVVSGRITFDVRGADDIFTTVFGAGEMIRIDPLDQHTIKAEEDSVLVELLSCPYDSTDVFKYGD